MFNEKLFLTPEDILDKIIHDYTEFMSVIKKLEQDNRILIEENNKIKAEYRKLRTNIEASEEASSNRVSVSNVDLLRRLSNLEKIVYKE